MAVCKTCGTRFQPSEEAPGCPQCHPAAAPRRRPTPKPAAGAPPARSATPSRPQATRAARQRVVERAVEEEEFEPEPTPRGRRAHASEPVDNTTKYGALAVLGLALVIGPVVLVVYNKKKAQQEAIEAYEASVKDVFTRVRELDPKDPDSAEKIIKIASEKESTWIDHPLAADIQARVVQAKASLTENEERRATLARFDGVEAELKKADVPSERMKDLRRQLDEMESWMVDSGAETAARFATVRLAADQAFAERVLAEARATRDANSGNPRTVLARYQPAEDEIKALLDRAFHAKKKEQQDFYTGLYKQAIEEADVIAEELYKAEGDKLPWIDCLAAPQAGNWNASSVSGFSHQVQGGVLKLIGPDAEAGKLAVISIGDREQWRHFVVDFEMEIEKGDLQLYLRLGRSPNANTLAYSLQTTGSDPSWPTAKAFAGRINLVGSKLEVRFEGDGADLDQPPNYDEVASWAASRKGGIGFVISPGARATITRFKVREIR